MGLLRPKYHSLILVVWLTMENCTGFQPSRPFLAKHNSEVLTQQPSARHDTTLNMALPTLIIGPMLKKMREKEQEKNAPLATQDEREGEAMGLKIGRDAWKWPPIWPYEDRVFTRTSEAVADPGVANSMAMMMNGGIAAPPVAAEMPEVEKMNPLEYWEKEKEGTTAKLDEDSAFSLMRHYGFYLKDGMSVLEFGAAEESYLPEDLELGRHVGVGASQSAMDKNPRLTEKLVVDLDIVVEQKGVDSEELRKLGVNTFDSIIMANTIDFLTEPREVFRTAWQLLKPGGRMIVAFTNKEAYSGEFGEAQTIMWKDYNDDQHMWVCGSFFQFSAGDGWENLIGFDVSPEGSEKNNVPLIGGLLNKDKPMNMFIVQANKAYSSEDIDESDPEKSFKSLMWMTPTLEERDKQLVAPRLGRTYQLSSSTERKMKVKENVDKLPKVYESLVKMDQFAFPFDLQAQLAADLVSDPDFEANEEQLLSLRMGLGLAKPSEELWAPVGQATAAMKPEDKVNLLSYIVPRCGSGDEEQEAAIESFVSGLKPTFEVIRSKCPSMSEADVQLVGSELLASEVLTVGRSSRTEFAAWLGAMTQADLDGALAKRKSFKETAEADMREMQKKRKEEKEKKEALLKKYEEQMAKAREERTMYFSEKTGKMVILHKKK